jgi:hypothetical protein
MTSSNQLRIGIVEESVYGTTPSSLTNDQILTVNATGHTLGNQNRTEQDPTIRSDRNVQDLVRLDRSAEGNINFAMRYSDDTSAESTLLRAVLQSGAEVAAPTEVTSVSGGAVALNGVTISAAGLFTTTAAHGLVDNVPVVLSGTVPSPYSASTYYYVKYKTATTFTVMAAPSGTEITSAATGTVTVTTYALAASGLTTNVAVGDVVRVRQANGTLVGYYPVVALQAGATPPTLHVEGYVPTLTGLKVLRGARMKNGSTQKSYSIEVAYPTTGLYETFKGCVFDGMDFTVAVEQMISGSYMIMGQRGSGVSTSPLSSTAAYYKAATTTSVMQAVDNIPNVRVAGIDYSARSISMRIANGGAAQKVVGSIGAQAIRSGTFTVTGQIAAYFASITEYNKMIANQASSLLLVTQDSSGNAYSWWMPKVKYGGVSVPVQGQDTDVVCTLDYQAVYDSLLGATVHVQRFAS